MVDGTAVSWTCDKGRELRSQDGPVTSTCYKIKMRGVFGGRGKPERTSRYEVWVESLSCREMRAEVQLDLGGR